MNYEIGVLMLLTFIAWQVWRIANVLLDVYDPLNKRFKR